VKDIGRKAILAEICVRVAIALTAYLNLCKLSHFLNADPAKTGLAGGPLATRNLYSISTAIVLAIAYSLQALYLYCISV